MSVDYLSNTHNTCELAYIKFGIEAEITKPQN